MVQVLLIILGLFLLIKGKIKVSDTREIERPASIYWGIIIIIYGIAVSFLPDQLTYAILFYASLLLISAIFVIKGKKIITQDASAKASDTKRNLIILLVFIAIIVAIFYFTFR